MLPLAVKQVHQCAYMVSPGLERWIILSNHQNYLMIYHTGLNKTEVSVILRKNITINEEHLSMLEPILEKHNNNLSAAVRDIIEYSDYTLKRFDNFESAKRALDERDVEKEIVYDVTIPLSMFKWLLTSRDGKMPSLEEVRQLFISQLFTEQEVDSLVRSINEQNKKMHWPLFIKCHLDRKNLYIIVTGVDQTINKFEAILLSQYLSNLDEPYVIKEMVTLPTSIQLQYEKGSCEDAQKELMKHFDVSAKIPENIDAGKNI